MRNFAMAEDNCRLIGSDDGVEGGHEQEGRQRGATPKRNAVKIRFVKKVDDIVFYISNIRHLLIKLQGIDAYAQSHALNSHLQVRPKLQTPLPSIITSSAPEAGCKLVENGS